MMTRPVRLITACVVLVASTSTAQQGAAQSFNSNGVRINYVDRGNGVPVVLLHGFTGSYTRHWEAPGVMKALETAGYRVIAMDLRGHGESEKPLDPTRYGIEMVQDVVRLLDHLNVARAHVVGFSLGGAIANQLLVKYPRRLMTVILVGAGWEGEGEDLRAFTSFSVAMADEFARKDASALVRRLTPVGQTPPPDEEVAKATASLFARNPPEVLAAVARSIPSLYEISANDLRASTVPVLAIVGEQDVAVEAVKRMAGVISALEVVTIPGADHPASIRPSAEHMVAFLDRHRRN